MNTICEASHPRGLRYAEARRRIKRLYWCAAVIDLQDNAQAPLIATKALFCDSYMHNLIKQNQDEALPVC